MLFLTWLLFGMYYVNRFNYSPMIPLLKGLPELSADQKQEVRAAVEPWKKEKNLQLAVSGILKRV